MYVSVQAYISDTNSTRHRPVFPPTFIPLNASDCMCRSMTELATLAGHSEIETNCRVINNCTSIRCNLNVLGTAYYLELAVSACDETIYLLVENSAFEVIHRSDFSSSGIAVIEIVPGFPLRTDVTLVPRDYSILIEVSEEPYIEMIANALYISTPKGDKPPNKGQTKSTLVRM